MSRAHFSGRSSQRASVLITTMILLIMLTVLSFNLLGDGLRDALDPRLRID